MGLKYDGIDITSVIYNDTTINQVVKDGVVVGRRAFTISFGTTSGKSLYGSGGSATKTAYYGDTITISGTTVTCTNADDSTTRWTNTVSASSNTAQYTYSTPTINESGFTVSGAASITAYNSRTVNQYTITWKYLSAYPDTYTTTTAVYKYGDTPGTTTPQSGSVPTPATVTSGSNRKVPGNWDSLATVTGARTITMGYTEQHYLTFTGTRCSCTSHSTGWYNHSTTAFTATWTASENCSFEGSAAKDTATQSITPNQAASYSKTANYIYVTIQAGTGCSASPSVGSKFVEYNTTCTGTPTTYYSFAAGTTQTNATESLTTPGGVYSKTPTNYKAASISASYSTVDKNNSTYYASGTTITWTADTNHSFNGSAVGDTTTATISAGGSFSKTPGYTKCAITGTRCSANKTNGAILANGTTITWTASDNYGFAEGTSRTATTSENVAINKYSYSASANYKNITVSGTNCTANVASGYRLLGATITWTGNTGTNLKYSFTNTPEKNPTDAQRQTTATISTDAASYSKTASYVYYNVTISPATNYSANKTSGYYINGATITFTAPTNTTTKRYSFSTSTSETHTQNKIVSSAGQTITNDTAYVWMNCTCTGTHCSATSGGYRVGTSITWTGETGTNYKYGFSSATNWDNSYATTTSTVVDGTTAYSKTASYLYYNVTISPATNCTANVSSGYRLNGTTVTFTTTNATDTVRYSFSTSASNTYTTSGTVSSAGQTISSGTVYKGQNCTCTGTNCTATAGWYRVGTSITWTRSTGYAFDASGTTTSTSTVVDGTFAYTKATTHGYLTLSPTNCTVTGIKNSGGTAVSTSGGATSSGWVALSGNNYTVTFKANSGWSFAGSTNQDTTTVTKAVPNTFSASPSYFYITVNKTNCTANVNSGFYTASTKPSSITWTRNTNYAFDSSGTTTYTNSSISSAPATYSASPSHAYLTVTATNCTANVSSGGKAISGNPYSVTFTAAENYSFNGTNTKDTTTVSDLNVPTSVSRNPADNYIYITTTATRSSITVGSTSRSSGWSGLVAKNTTITGTASNGYSFAAGTSQTATSTATVSTPGTYSKSADYKNITVNTPSTCTVNVASGYRHLGDSITGTRKTATNTKYSFSNTSADVTTNPTSTVISTGIATYNCPDTVYTWYNVTSVTGTNCTAYTNTNYNTAFATGQYYLSTTQIYWKITTTGYCFDQSNNAQTTTVSVVAGNNNKSTTLPCRYTFTLTKNTNVATCKVWRTESPRQGAATSTESSPMLSATGTAYIYYGDKLSGSATTATGYHFGSNRSTTTDSYSNTGVTGNASYGPTANINQYTITFTRQIQTAASHTTLNTASADTSIGDASVVVNYNGSYSKTFSKTNYVSQTKSGSNVTADATVTVTLVPVTYNLTKSLTNWTGNGYTNTNYNTTITWMYHGYTAYFRATPNSYYEQTISSTRYYNGQYYTTSVSNAAGSATLSATAITYTVKPATVTGGSVAWSPTTGTYSALSGTGSTYTITANTHYDRPSTYTANIKAFTYSDANKTATSTAPAACTYKKYTVSGTSTNGTVYWSTSAINSSGGQTSISNITYGTTVYYRIDASTGYNRPSTYYGSLVVNDSNFTVSDTNLTATKTLTACSIQTCTVTGKKLSAYPDTGTTTTTTVNYNATPTPPSGGETPATVTNSGSTERKANGTWGTIAKIAANEGTRTVQASYTQQYYVKITATNSTAHKGAADGPTINSGSSDWYDAGTQTITWVPNTNYSFSEGTSQTSTSVIIDSSAAQSKSPGYGYVTVTKTHCTGIDTGYRAIGNTTFTRTTGYAYSASGTTTETKSVTAGGSITSSPGYGYLTVSAGTNCTAGESSSWKALGSYQVEYTASTGYAFDGSGTNKKKCTAVSVPGTTTAPTITHGYMTISATNCVAKIGSDTVTTGWKALGSYTVKFTANTGWSFGGSTAGDTTSGETKSVPNTGTGNPGYIQFTVTGTNCTAKVGSETTALTNNTNYIRAKNSTINGTSNSYYSASEGTTQTHPTSATITAPGNYSASSTYKYVTVTKENCTGIATGYRSSPTTFSANTNYSYQSGTTRKATSDSISFDANGTITKAASSPGYSKAASISGTYCDADKNANTYYANGATITGTRRAGYAFDSSGKTTTTATLVAGGNHSKECEYAYFGISATNCARSSGDTQGGKTPVSTKVSCTVTASDNYSFAEGTSRTATSSISNHTLPYTGEVAPGYGYLGTSTTNCSVSSIKNPNNSDVAVGYRALSNGNNYTVTFNPATNYSFNGTNSSSTTVSHGLPYTFSASPGYAYLNIGQKSNCTVSANGEGGYTVGSTVTTTFSADTGGYFGSTSSDTTTTTTTTVPGTTSSVSPTYCLIKKGTCSNCSSVKIGSTNVNASGIIARLTANDANSYVTYTASDLYSWAEGTSRTATTTTNITSPTTVNKTPEYGYGNITYTNCTKTSGTDNGYRSTSVGIKATAQAAAGGSFGGSSESDEKTTNSGANAYPPYSETLSPAHFYITVGGSHNSSISKSSGWYTSSTKPSSITGTPATYYSYESGGTQKSFTENNIAAEPGSYSATPSYIRARSIATGTYNASVNRNSSTYYAADTIVTWTAGSNYSYGGQSTGDTTTNGNTKITAGADIGAPNPGYVKCTIDSTRCTANQTDGAILAVTTDITYTHDDGYSYTEHASTPSNPTKQTVALGTTSYGRSCDYKYITVSNNNTYTTCDTATGYRLLGDPITGTRKTGTGLKYSFSDTNEDSTESTDNIKISKSSYSCPDAISTWYNVKIVPKTHSTADQATGYRLANSTLTVTGNTDASTSTEKYSFDNINLNDNETQTLNITITTANQTIDGPTVYTGYKVTVSAYKCTARLDNYNGNTIVSDGESTDGYCSGTYIYFKSNSNNGSFSEGRTPSMAEYEQITSAAPIYKEPSYIRTNITVADGSYSVPTAGLGGGLPGTGISYYCNEATTTEEFSFSASDMNDDIKENEKVVPDDPAESMFITPVPVHHGYKVTTQGTHCSAYADAAHTTPFTDNIGYKTGDSNEASIYGLAEDGYCFDNDNSKTAFDCLISDTSHGEAEAKIKVYTVTWKGKNDQNGLETAAETYHGGETPSRAAPSPTTVTVDTTRYILNTTNYTNGGDNLSAIYADRAINAVYTTQYYVKINAPYSTAHLGEATGSTITAGSSDGYNHGQIITGVPGSGYSYAAGTSQTNTDRTITSATTLGPDPSYLYITINKTNCSGEDTGYRLSGLRFQADDGGSFGGSTNQDYSDDYNFSTPFTTINPSPGYIYVTIESLDHTSKNKSTGFQQYNTCCTYEADNGYAFDNSGGKWGYSDNFTTAYETYECEDNLAYAYLTFGDDYCTANRSNGGYQRGLALGSTKYTVASTYSSGLAYTSSGGQTKTLGYSNVIIDGPANYKYTPTYAYVTVAGSADSTVKIGSNPVTTGGRSNSNISAGLSGTQTCNSGGAFDTSGSANSTQASGTAYLTTAGFVVGQVPRYGWLTSPSTSYDVAKYYLATSSSATDGETATGRGMDRLSSTAYYLFAKAASLSFSNGTPSGGTFVSGQAGRPNAIYRYNYTYVGSTGGPGTGMASITGNHTYGRVNFLYRTRASVQSSGTSYQTGKGGYCGGTREYYDSISSGPSTWGGNMSVSSYFNPNPYNYSIAYGFGQTGSTYGVLGGVNTQINASASTIYVYYSNNGNHGITGTLGSGGAKASSGNSVTGSNQYEYYVVADMTVGSTPTLSAPECEYDYDNNIDIKVINNNSVTVKVYIDGVYKRDLDAGGDGGITVDAFRTYYNVQFKASGYNDSPVTRAWSGYYIDPGEDTSTS